MIWHKEIFESLEKGDYQKVIEFYEKARENQPDEISHYWHLGLAYLLAEKEEDAQSIWLSVFAAASETEIELWTNQLIEILDTEAQRLETAQNYQLSWLIRGHLKEIAPELVTNLLHLIILEINLKLFHPNKLTQWQLIQLLENSHVDLTLLSSVLGKVLEFPYVDSVEFAEACLRNSHDHLDIIQQILNVANKMANHQWQKIYAADLMQLCLKRQPDNVYILKTIFWFYLAARDYEKTIAVAQDFYDKCNSLTLKVFANFQIIYAYMLFGNWLEVQPIAERHKALIAEMIQQECQNIEPVILDSFIIVTQPFLYLQDNLAENRWLQNKIAQLFQASLQTKTPVSLAKSPRVRLKIGYIAHTLRAHSVGWLSRWLFKYHDRNSFDLTIYMINQPEDKLTEQWFRANVDQVYNFFGQDRVAIAAQIAKDEIDILVDLDSLTLNVTCQVMALKPAPIQVTWLGLDASGLPSIDYFIADPYVLPDYADTHYQEKIWRLPQTYLAIDGFEVGVPTLRREDLEIADDAIVYLSVQSGLKYHPETIRLQMKILKAVNHSYLLIKGRGDEALIKNLFNQIAQEEGVSFSRLRFLPKDATEEIHRANLAIADVVLDTYPYNGATTTLEVLWMGIPLVTRVGEQFAARNSYGFMKNAGLTEGIALCDQEYVEWGIKFGVDANLRQQVTWKLKNSRQTSALWNAKEFTLEMEKAYQQMYKNLI